MSNCGCRSRELLTLKYSDINFNHPNWNKEMDNSCVEITIRKINGINAIDNKNLEILFIRLTTPSIYFL